MFGRKDQTFTDLKAGDSVIIVHFGNWDNSFDRHTVHKVTGTQIVVAIATDYIRRFRKDGGREISNNQSRDYLLHDDDEYKAAEAERKELCECQRLQKELLDKLSYDHIQLSKDELQKLQKMIINHEKRS